MLCTKYEQNMQYTTIGFWSYFIITCFSLLGTFSNNIVNQHFVCAERNVYLWHLQLHVFFLYLFRAVCDMIAIIKTCPEYISMNVVALLQVKQIVIVNCTFMAFDYKTLKYNRYTLQITTVTKL